MPRVQNPGLGPGQQAMLTSVVQLSAAQISALHTTPITVVPAPGAGKIVFVLAGVIVYSFGTRKFLPQDANGVVWVYANNTAIGLNSSNGQLLASAQSEYSAAAAFTFPQVPILPGGDNQAVQVWDDTLFNQGPISTTTLGAGGTGYVANDTGTITTGSADATYKVLTVGAGGAVLTYQITGAGTQYATANGVATATGGAQPGVGIGFTVNITAVSTGDGTLKVVTYYQIIPVP